jgi:anti-sigma factor RsiW
MSSCIRRPSVQSYLDGDLAPEDAAAFRAHLPGCPACASDLALYSRVFAALAQAPTWDPGPELTERVLARVLPSQVRRRAWVRALGWGYAVTLTGCLAAMVALAVRPGSIGFLASVWVAASHRVLQFTIFTLDAASIAVVSLANGWGLLRSAGGHMAPLGRAFTTVFAHRSVESALWSAGAACVLLLWWMRPRGRRSNGGVRHVGLLGF